MTHECLAVAPVIAALALPAESQVEQRVPKKMLLEQDAPTSADRRAIRDGIESILWVAALKPTNVGVPAYRDDMREYLEIAVLTLTLRGNTKGARIAELIHRAIPYPVVLVTESGGGCMVSLAHKRWSQGEAGKVVIEDVQCTPPFQPDEPSETEAAFFASLVVAGLPRANLFVLYQGWIDRVLGLTAAGITGHFALPGAAAPAGAVVEDVEAHRVLERELIALRARASKERQINRRVELNLEINRREAEMTEIAQRLGGTKV
jgi:hypothetical protein